MADLASVNCVGVESEQKFVGCGVVGWCVCFVLTLVMMGFCVVLNKDVSCCGKWG